MTAARPAPATVQRPRLVRLLERGAQGRVTVVGAPAGFGKSVLIGAWLRAAAARPDGAAPVLVRPTDALASPARFWSGILARLDLDLGPGPASVPAGSGELSAEELVLLTADRVRASDRPVVLVVDCGERVLAPGVGAGVARLLDECEAFRAVLVARADPPVPLSRYRLGDDLTEIRADDLAFTAAETASLARLAGLELDARDVMALRELTGGWPAGLKLATVDVRGADEPGRAIRQLRGSRGELGAYLTTEVLARQQPRLRDLMLRTCLVEDLVPGLVTALTGEPDGVGALEELVREGALLEPLPGAGARYRYRPLLRDLLRSRLALEQPRWVRGLHLTAAEWYRDEGQWEGAVRHAVRAGDWAAAAASLVAGPGAVALVTGDRVRELRELVGGLPRDVAGPQAALVRAALALAVGAVERCGSELERAREAVSTAPADVVDAGRGQLAVLEAMCASVGPDLDRALDAALVAERTSAGAAAPRSVVACCLARVLLRRGSLGAARAALEHGLGDPAAEGTTGHTELVGLAALIEAVAGHLGRAAQLAGRCGRDTPTAVLATAWVQLERASLESAAETLDACGPQATGSRYDAGLLVRVHALLRARLAVLRGDGGFAHAVLRTATGPVAATSGQDWFDRALLLTEADLLLDEGRVAEAARVAPGARGRAEPPAGPPDPAGAPPSERVARSLAEADRLLAAGLRGEADAVLRSALRLARPELIRRPFLASRADVRDALHRGGSRSLGQWLWSAPNDGAGQSPSAPNPLSAKEQEVLVLLAELLRTDEIADELFVSVNTVRSHVRSILRKLEVTRRNEAVRRAWELGLLPRRTTA